jgi:hypothetical protein
MGSRADAVAGIAIVLVCAIVAAQAVEGSPAAKLASAGWSP